MEIHNKSIEMLTLPHGGPSKGILLGFAILAFLGPNGLYLYTSVTQPELNWTAMANPIALVFIIEAFMLLGLFLWFVHARTRSWKQVFLYFILAMLGSLAFSLPVFLYRNSRNG